MDLNDVPLRAIISGSGELAQWLGAFVIVAKHPHRGLPPPWEANIYVLADNTLI